MYYLADEQDLHCTNCQKGLAFSLRRRSHIPAKAPIACPHCGEEEEFRYLKLAEEERELAVQFLKKTLQSVAPPDVH